MVSLYDMREIFFTINGIEIEDGKIEYDCDPKEFAYLSSEDRGYPTASFRDPRTVNHIFNVEVTLGSLSYHKLNDLSHAQFYVRQRKEDKYKSLVFNDGFSIKITTNHALFTEMPSRNYVTEAEKI